MICVPRTFLPLILTAACGVPASAQGQAILVEAYHAGAEAALADFDTKKAARLYALALTEARNQANAGLTARVLLGAANLHIQMSQFAEAEANVKAGLAICEHLPEAEPGVMLVGLNLLAMNHFFQRHFEDAEALYAQLIADLTVVEGKDGVRLGIALNDMARVQVALHQPAKAEKLAIAATMIMEAKFGPGCANVAQCLDTRAQALDAAGQHEAAAELTKQALEICRLELGPGHAQFGAHLQTLGMIQRSLGKHEESSKSLEQSLTIQRRQRGDDHPLVTEVRAAWSRQQAQPNLPEPAATRGKASPPPGDPEPSSATPAANREPASRVGDPS